ncbi:CHC2 zinc finger domain-containing protein [Micromonospora sp. NPDC049751]|uniref:CHC2 zinc finger domain-containing protein n=1 Tax=Micromonospora sp. NPDC049751 TaxID=3154837 RepID=UPI0033CCA9C2
MRVSQMVRCPLQEEDRTPSMSINTEKELWRCHSCGKGGDAWTLIMEKEGIDYRAARALATAVGFAAGSSGGSDQRLSGSAYGGRRKVPAGKGNRPGGSSYRPSWRRS